MDTPIWSPSRVRANGIELAYEETGPSNGEPVVLVMGLAGQLIAWPDKLCTDLAARGYRVIRFDNRDIGLSGDGDRGVRFDIRRDFVRVRLRLRPGPSNYTLHDMSADTLGLMDALGIGRAHLVGVSMGGMIAQITAAKAPQRVKSLTSIMSGTNNPWIRQTRLDLMIRMVTPLKDHRRETSVERNVATYRLIGSPGWPMPEEERREWAGRAYDRAFRPGGVLRQIHAIVVTGSFEPLLKSITAPTLVIHGTDDPLMRPACGVRSAKLIPGAKLEMIEGMGHDLPPELMPRWAESIDANARRSR